MEFANTETKRGCIRIYYRPGTDAPDDFGRARPLEEVKNVIAMGIDTGCLFYVHLVPVIVGDRLEDEEEHLEMVWVPLDLIYQIETDDFINDAYRWPLLPEYQPPSHR